MEQQVRTCQVFEEAVTQAGAFGCAFDQAGNVGDDEAAVRTTPRVGCSVVNG